MYLSKRCWKEHNINTSKTIKVGTLYEYQHIEDDELVDGDEGKFTFSINLEGRMELDIDIINGLFQGFGKIEGGEGKYLNSGIFHSKDTNFKMISSNGVTAIIEDCKTTIYRESFNKFVFCMSLVDSKDDALKILPHYDDCWYLDYSKADDFSHMLGFLVRSAVQECRSAGQHGIDPSVPIEEIKVACWHERVSYIPREMHITSASTEVIQEFMEKNEDMAFIKPPQFQNEREYRFSFVFYDSNDREIPILSNYIVFKSEDLFDLVNK